MLAPLQFIFASMLVTIAAAQASDPPINVKMYVIYVGNKWDPVHISTLNDFFTGVPTSSWMYPLRSYRPNSVLTFSQHLIVNYTMKNEWQPFSEGNVVLNAMKSNNLTIDGKGLYIVISDAKSVKGHWDPIDDYDGTFGFWNFTKIGIINILWIGNSGVCDNELKEPRIGATVANVASRLWEIVSAYYRGSSRTYYRYSSNPCRDLKVIRYNHPQPIQTCFDIFSKTTSEFSNSNCSTEFGGHPWSLPAIPDKNGRCHQALNDTNWKQQLGTDFAQSDLETISEPSHGLLTCGLKCESNPSCVGFTFDQSRAKCVLKSAMNTGQSSSSVDAFLYKRTTCNSGEIVDFGKKCTQCSAGQVPDAAKAKCVACTGTSYSNAGDATCKTCAAGFECKNGIATKCAAGKVSVSGVGNCTTCDAGKVPDGTNAACVACTGTTWSNAGDAACKPCPQGSVCQNGLAKTCIAGQVPNTAQTQCVNQTSGQTATNATKSSSSNSTNSTSASNAQSSSNSTTASNAQNTSNSTTASNSSSSSSSTASTESSSDDSKQALADSAFPSPSTTGASRYSSGVTTSCTKCKSTAGSVDSVQYGNAAPSTSSGYSAKPQLPTANNVRTDPIGQTEVTSAANHLATYFTVSFLVVLFL